MLLSFTFDKNSSSSFTVTIFSFLNPKFTTLGLGKYQKKMKGNPKLAIRYAKRIIKNGEGKTPAEIAPGTKVYELVEELAKYLPEKIQKQIVE